ncbi:MAG: WbqC family protein [Proteobacteria bacterium]|nr:WbqC family protein [Pseudomonadota bacterium]
MIVAIHQPNYAPWLGFFAKIARAGIFVFLDDVQFTKNGYTNRVQVSNNGQPHWLTLPVSVHLGDNIDAVRPAQADWPERHCAALQNFYRSAPAFKAEWPEIRKIYESLPGGNLADINIHLVIELARILGLPVQFARSSELDTAGSRGDERLVRIVNVLAPGGTYLSGEGGRNYQTDGTFADKGIRLDYLNFKQPEYAQRGTEFLRGLSVLDAIFELGRIEATRLITPHLTS